MNLLLIAQKTYYAFSESGPCIESVIKKYLLRLKLPLVCKTKDEIEEKLGKV